MFIFLKVYQISFRAGRSRSKKKIIRNAERKKTNRCRRSGASPTVVWIAERESFGCGREKVTVQIDIGEKSIETKIIISWTFSWKVRIGGKYLWYWKTIEEENQE